MDPAHGMKMTDNEEEKGLQLDEEDKQHAQISCWKTLAIKCFVNSASVIADSVSGQFFYYISLLTAIGFN